MGFRVQPGSLRPRWGSVTKNRGDVAGEARFASTPMPKVDVRMHDDFVLRHFTRCAHCGTPLQGRGRAASRDGGIPYRELDDRILEAGLGPDEGNLERQVERAREDRY